MESTGIPSRVQISKNVVENIEEGEFAFEPRGKIQMKGKGLIEAFMLKERLRPKDMYLVGPDIVAPTEDTLAAVTATRRASTLQSTLMVLQSSMREFQNSGSISHARTDSSSVI